MEDKLKMYAGIALGIGVVWFILTRKGIASDIASATTQAAVGAATGAAAGVVQGVGLAVGVPLTDVQQCEIACAAGDGWKASQYCTAGRFVDYLRTGK